MSSFHLPEDEPVFKIAEVSRSHVQDGIQWRDDPELVADLVGRSGMSFQSPAEFIADRDAARNGVRYRWRTAVHYRADDEADSGDEHEDQWSDFDRIGHILNFCKKFPQLVASVATCQQRLSFLGQWRYFLEGHRDLYPSRVSGVSKDELLSLHNRACEHFLAWMEERDGVWAEELRTTMFTGEWLPLDVSHPDYLVSKIQLMSAVAVELTRDLRPSSRLLEGRLRDLESHHIYDLRRIAPYFVVWSDDTHTNYVVGKQEMIIMIVQAADCFEPLETFTKTFAYQGRGIVRFAMEKAVLHVLDEIYNAMHGRVPRMLLANDLATRFGELMEALEDRQSRRRPRELDEDEFNDVARRIRARHERYESSDSDSDAGSVRRRVSELMRASLRREEGYPSEDDDEDEAKDDDDDDDE